MHEVAITQEIIEICCHRCDGTRIKRIVLEIGKLSGVFPEAVRFCFDLCAAGTPAEGSTLEILEPIGMARCRSCGEVIELTGPFMGCICGSYDMEWRSGYELKIKEMEVV